MMGYYTIDYIHLLSSFRLYVWAASYGDYNTWRQVTARSFFITALFPLFLVVCVQQKRREK